MQGAALEALVEALQNEEEAQEIVNQAQQVLHSCLYHMIEDTCVSLTTAFCTMLTGAVCHNGMFILMLKSCTVS